MRTASSNARRHLSWAWLKGTSRVRPRTRTTASSYGGPRRCRYADSRVTEAKWSMTRIDSAIRVLPLGAMCSRKVRSRASFGCECRGPRRRTSPTRRASSGARSRRCPRGRSSLLGSVAPTSTRAPRRAARARLRAVLLEAGFELGDVAACERHLQGRSAGLSRAPRAGQMPRGVEQDSSWNPPCAE